MRELKRFSFDSNKEEEKTTQLKFQKNFFKTKITSS